MSNLNLIIKQFLSELSETCDHVVRVFEAEKVDEIRNAFLTNDLDLIALHKSDLKEATRLYLNLYNDADLNTDHEIRYFACMCVCKVLCACIDLMIVSERDASDTEERLYKRIERYTRHLYECKKEIIDFHLEQLQK